MKKRFLHLFFSACFFFIAASSYASFDMDTASKAYKLEDEIMKILREQHGYTGSGFLALDTSKTFPEQYLQSLKNFKEALTKTKKIRNFENIFTFSMSRSFETTEYGNSKVSLDFDITAPVAAYIGMLSSDPDNEPLYQAYLKANKKKYQAKFKKNIGPWSKYHLAGKKLLCDIGFDVKTRLFGLRVDNSELEKQIERLTGKKVRSVERGKSNSTNPNEKGVVFKWIKVWLESGPPASILVVGKFNSAGMSESYVQVSKKESLRDDRLANAHLDSDCNVKRLEVWRYDEGLLQARKIFNSRGELLRTIIKREEVRSLEKIYGECQPGGALENIYTMAARVDRVLVAILDSGVDYNHPDIAYKIHNRSANEVTEIALEKKRIRLRLKKKRIKRSLEESNFVKKLWYEDEYKVEIANLNHRLQDLSSGWNYNNDTNKPYDYSYTDKKGYSNHGTHVAGIIVEETDELSLLPLRYSNDRSDAVYEAVELAHRKGARIINLSISTTSGELVQAFKKAIEDHPDMLFVVAAGNLGNDLKKEPDYPAAFDHPNILVVASVDGNNRLARDSNYSRTKVDIAALGVFTYSISPGESLSLKSGTSFSAPLVTRVAAKIKAINPTLSPTQIISIIRRSTTPIAALRRVVKFGGVINEQGALELAHKSRLN